MEDIVTKLLEQHNYVTHNYVTGDDPSYAVTLFQEAAEEIMLLRQQLVTANKLTTVTLKQRDEARRERRILENAGFFRDGEDALSLVAAFQTMSSEVLNTKELRKERDEVRRQLCIMHSGRGGLTAEELADIRGWDCFKDDNK